MACMVGPCLHDTIYVRVCCKYLLQFTSGYQFLLRAFNTHVHAHVVVVYARACQCSLVIEGRECSTTITFSLIIVVVCLIIVSY